MILYCLINSTV